MDEDGLPIVGSGVDLTKVPAIQQKRIVAFLNQFIVHTVRFLNRFSTVCEEKLASISLRIQQIETTLNILEAKLSSIPGLEDVKVEGSSQRQTAVTNGSVSDIIQPETPAAAPTAQVKKKKKKCVCDILYTPDAPVPDGGVKETEEESNSSGSESSFSD
ncbi:WASH complex subunit 3 [Acipenser ruthenus]|uniref:WASH complex subunit 3 n=1 Tax=Acipenser ruthenus TaxID=7906 RepID=UPI002741E9F7|nr:WASH complex subunit 3 [Acipenser ruthenus]